MKLKLLAAAFFATAFLSHGTPAPAADSAKAAKLDREARAALQNLYATTPAAKSLAGKAVAVLVFPTVTKAGFMVGGQYGEGALIRGGKTVAYYSTAGASYGLQAGAQQYGYAMIFMHEGALKQLESNEGFEVGVGPSVVVVDEGMAKSTTTKTLDKDIYAFIFGQKGLMAGLGIQGNKITRMVP
jgi:lipid-binding SYLF domain-containing protein